MLGLLLIDRYILLRFAANFVILFLLLFVFAVAIDVILNLDKFVDAARHSAGPDAVMARVAWELLRLITDFEGPRVFQFYAYLHGLAAIGAMGFTLAQMHRYRELVAVLASGVSLYRLAMPFIVAVFGLSVLQLLNQELVLPRIAPLLLRDYRQLGEHRVESFEVRFTPDGANNLLQSPSFDPQSATLILPTILERDERGQAIRRITASSATWSESQKAWVLSGGVAIRPRSPGLGQAASAPETIDVYPSALTPRALLVHHYSQFAAMLSLNQISQMLDTPRIADRATLLRYRYARFASVLVNLLVLTLTLPSFLLREPANLLRQSVKCAALALPATIGSAIGMMVQLPGIPPAVGVFLPVIVLGFMSLFPWTFFKT